MLIPTINLLRYGHLAQFWIIYCKTEAFVTKVKIVDFRFFL